MKRVFSGACAFALCLIAVLAIAGSASAATVGASGNAFYNMPSSIPTSAHGTLLTYRNATINLGAGAPSVKGWNITYKSTDSNGAGNIVSGTVIVPTASWTGFGSRPVITYAIGTHGLNQACAASNKIATGGDYEAANIAAALSKNYAVVITDYAGYMNGQVPTYVAGKSEGQAVLDAVVAAYQVPSVGLSSSTKVGIWGYSQGGQAADWAAQLESTYTPSLNVVGTAAGGVPGDFNITSDYLNGSTGASFLLQAVVGLGTEYPSAIDLNGLTNAAGKAAIADIKTKCVFQALFDYMNKDIKNYTASGQTLADLKAIPSIGATLTAQNLGGTKPAAPLYQYHGRADEFIPLAQAIDLKKKYCNLGQSVKFDVYPSEHITTQFQAAPNVLSWFADRFNGLPQILGNCLQLAAPPTSTANPGGGDFNVSLNKWPLSGSMYINGNLHSTIQLPSASTFDATADMTSHTLTGDLAVPSFKTSVSLLGLPVDVNITLTPVGRTTGTVSIDNNGILHLSGVSKNTITIDSVGEIGVNIPIGCKTSTPVSFPLSYNGPVSSLGNGNLTFTGTTTFPSLTGCGLIYGPALGLLFSGSGNTYSFTVKPPAPTAY